MNTHPAVARHNENHPMSHPILGEDNPGAWIGLRVSFLTGTTKNGSIAQHTGEIQGVEFDVHGSVYFVNYVIREDATGVEHVIGSGRVKVANVSEETEERYCCYVSYNGYDRCEETVCQRPTHLRGVCESCERAEETNRWRKFVYLMGHDVNHDSSAIAEV